MDGHFPSGHGVVEVGLEPAFVQSDHAKRQQDIRAGIGQLLNKLLGIEPSDARLDTPPVDHGRLEADAGHVQDFAGSKGRHFRCVHGQLHGITHT